MNLKTRYLGFDLEHPIVPSAGPMTKNLDSMRRLEDAGAPMLVLASLFEEQILRERVTTDHYLDQGAESHFESQSYLHAIDEIDGGLIEYLSLIEKAKKAVSVPIVASLNGVDAGGWLDAAKYIQNAGADAIELNVYYLAMNVDETAADVEKRYMDILTAVKSTVDIPIAMKLPPYLSSPGHLCRALADGGTSGLVLFNRFYQPDIDLEELELRPSITLSTSADIQLPLRWIALLQGKVKCDFALSSGIHVVEDVVKGLMVGAAVTHTTSALLAKGPELISELRTGLERWLEENEYESVEQLQGSMSIITCPNPSALARTNYMRTLYSWSTESAPTLEEG